AGSADPEHQRDLLEVYGLLAKEYDYRPVDRGAVPYGEFARAFGQAHPGRVVHNYGALGCLERLLELLRDDGFLLLNDYGPTQAEGADEPEHQRFSHATFIGVNFPLLQAYFTKASTPTPHGYAGKCGWVEPTGEEPRFTARLSGPQPGAAPLARFGECFSRAHREGLAQPVRQARTAGQAGRFETAAAAYRLALERQPGNWVLLNEVAL